MYSCVFCSTLLLHVAAVHFLLLCSIPLYDYHDLWIHSSIDENFDCFQLWLLWIKLLWTFLYLSFSEHTHLFLLVSFGIYTLLPYFPHNHIATRGVLIVFLILNINQTLPLLCSKSSNGLVSSQNKIQGLLSWSTRPCRTCTHTYPAHTLFFLHHLTSYPLSLPCSPSLCATRQCL